MQITVLRGYAFQIVKNEIWRTAMLLKDFFLLCLAFSKNLLCSDILHLRSFILKDATLCKIDWLWKRPYWDWRLRALHYTFVSTGWQAWGFTTLVKISHFWTFQLIHTSLLRLLYQNFTFYFWGRPLEQIRILGYERPLDSYACPDQSRWN